MAARGERRRKRKASGRSGEPPDGAQAPESPGLATGAPRPPVGLDALSSALLRLVGETPVRGLRMGRALLLSPGSARMRREAGRYLRELRELAGLTIDDLTAALDLRDESLLAAVENGTAVLSFELILRLAALLARNDPLPFVSRMVRSYNPALWRILEGWGIGRIPLQLERERRFVNVFRGHDAARALSDEGFERVLHFTRAAFEMALGFVAEAEGAAGPPRRGGARRAQRPARRSSRRGDR